MRRPEFELFVLHGGGTLPESHRLRSIYRVFSCARWLGGDPLLREALRFGQVRREHALQGHDVGAEAVGAEVIALAGPFITVERDRMGVVVAAEPDVEAFDADPFGLRGIALRLLDHGDEARVHEHPPTVIRTSPDRLRRV